MNIVTRKLIAKEIYVYRWFLVGASVAGVVTVLICALGKTGFNVGSLGWITTIVALGVMLGIYGISYERKENALSFVLSLPLDAGDYVRAKVIGLGICFFVPWLISSVAAMVLILAKESVPDGLVPYTVLLCVFMFTNFCWVVCGALHGRTEAWMTTVIIITNMAVSIFMFTVGAIPGIQDTMFGAVPVWNDTFWTVLVIELLALIVALVLPQFTVARRRDFI